MSAETDPGARIDADAPSSGEDRLADAMATLWQRHQSTNLARVEVLERATIALLESGDLDDVLRDEARVEAHKLAGALGTFGFADGTDGAREAELMLRGGELDAERLARIVVHLNETMVRPVPGGVAAVQPPPDGRHTGVVLVTDDVDLAEGVSRAAARTGRDVMVVAGQTVPSEVPEGSVVLVDLGDRFERGLELLGWLSRHRPGSLTMVATSNETFDVRLAVARSGALGLVPRELPPQQLLEAVEALRADREPATGRVLVLDDDPSVLDSVALVLGSSGLDVATVQNAAECFDELARERPDLVVVDLGLPGVDGIDVCRMVRADRRWSRVALLVMTSDASPEAIERAYRAGADDFLAKPVTGPALRGRARALLTRQRREGGIGDVGPGVKDQAGLLEYLDALERIARRRHARLTVAAVALAPDSDLEPTESEAAVRRVATTLRTSCRVEDAVGLWDAGCVVVGLLGADDAQTRHRMVSSLNGGELPGVRRRDGTEATVRLRMSAVEMSDERIGVSGLVSSVLEALDAAVDFSHVPSSGPDDLSASTDDVDVVIVDDDDVLADLLTFALESRGLRSYRFDDGVEAARALCTSEVVGRVVLLDVGLPGMDGFSVLSSLRRDGVLDRSQVLVLTARSGEGETMRALELGASDHVAKPFSVPILMERVERLLRSSP